MKNYIESGIQQVFIRWFRLQYAKYASVAIAVPNGGVRSRVEAVIMVAFARALRRS